jgi:hypothetical protein
MDLLESTGNAPSSRQPFQLGIGEKALGTLVISDCGFRIGNCLPHGVKGIAHSELSARQWEVGTTHYFGSFWCLVRSPQCLVFTARCLLSAASFISSCPMLKSAKMSLTWAVAYGTVGQLSTKQPNCGYL